MRSRQNPLYRYLCLYQVTVGGGICPVFSFHTTLSRRWI